MSIENCDGIRKCVAEGMIHDTENSSMINADRVPFLLNNESIPPPVYMN